MANIKISELNALTPPAAADELPVVDVSASSTKKTTVGEVVGIINGDVEVATDGTATISELPVSKLQDGDARQLLQTDAAGTGVEWTSNIDVPGTLDVTGATTLDSTLGVNGQSTLSSAAVSDLTSGRVVLAGASGELEDNAALAFNGTQLDVDGDVVITGDLTVEGASTILETETVKVEDKNIELGVVASPTDTTADGGGITLKGATDKTLNWVNATDAWTSSEPLDLPAGADTAPALFFNGDTNTGLYSPGADQVAISTNGTGRLFVDSSGDLKVIQAGANGNIRYLDLEVYGGTATDGNGVLRFKRSRSSVDGTQTAVGNNTLGEIAFLGSDGSSFVQGASIKASGFGTWSGTDRASYITFSTVADGTTTLNERLRITDDGKLGLGTSSPNSLLETLGTSSGGEVQGIRLTNSSTATSSSSSIIFNLSTAAAVNAKIQAIRTNSPTSSDTELAFSQLRNGTLEERLRIDSLGRVGIGTTSPQGPLDVVTGSSGAIFRFDSASTWLNILPEDANGVVALRYRANSGSAPDLVFRNDAGTETGRLTNDGKLLVGTSSASGSYLLQVNGDATIQGVTVGRGAGTNSVNTALGINALSANTTGANNTALGWGALDANTTGAGNTTIGYTAGGSITTGNYNTIIGSGMADYVTALTTGSWNTMLGYSSNPSSASVSGEMLICSGNFNFSGKGSNTGFIQPNGGGVYQGNNSSSWSTTSDRRLKKNIVDNTEGLEIINQVRVVNFEYRLPEEIEDDELKSQALVHRNEDDEITGLQGIKLGVIAQELQQVCSDCVKEETTGVMSVVDDNLFWHLINAVKELSAEVDALKAQIQAH